MTGSGRLLPSKREGRPMKKDSKRQRKPVPVREKKDLPFTREGRERINVSKSRKKKIVGKVAEISLGSLSFEEKRRTSERPRAERAQLSGE